MIVNTAPSNTETSGQSRGLGRISIRSLLRIAPPSDPKQKSPCFDIRHSELIANSTDSMVFSIDFYWYVAMTS